MAAQDDADLPFEPNEEVKKLEWLTLKESVQRLSHREQAELVRSVYQIEEELPRQCSLASYTKLLARPLQKNRWQRLDSEIEAYKGELRGRRRCADCDNANSLSARNYHRA